METLDDILDRVEARRKTFDVYTDDAEVAEALESQFSTRNVDVRRRDHRSGDEGDFVVIRDADGAFLAALGIDRLDQILSPEIHPPWELDDSGVDLGDVLDFLDETPFTSFERRQLLAVAREFEERAWRVGTGALFVGFQRRAALAAQTAVYNTLARESDLRIVLFLDGDAPPDLDDSIRVVTADSPEIGRYWFLAFDGGEEDGEYAGALVAAEREPGQYYGFWTDDPELVDEVETYLRTRYCA